MQPSEDKRRHGIELVEYRLYLESIGGGDAADSNQAEKKRSSPAKRAREENEITLRGALLTQSSNQNANPKTKKNKNLHQQSRSSNSTSAMSEEMNRTSLPLYTSLNNSSIFEDFEPIAICQEVLNWASTSCLTTQLSASGTTTFDSAFAGILD